MEDRKIPKDEKFMLKIVRSTQSKINSNLFAHFRMVKKAIMGESTQYCNGKIVCPIERY